MEILGVLFATVLMILGGIYYTVFPTLLNLVVAFIATVRLTRDRGGFAGAVTFVTISVALTFVSRAPDFLYDWATRSEDVAVVTKPLVLAPGDRLYVSERFSAFPFRGGYFTTSGYRDVEFTMRVGGPDFGTEDPLYHLRTRGVNLVFRNPPPGEPALRFRRDAGWTHQHLTMSVSIDDDELAGFDRTERLYFADELGAGILRHHLLHATKNTLWNWIARGLQTRRVPLSAFLDDAVRLEGSPPSVALHDVAPRLEAHELSDFNDSGYRDGTHTQLDCTLTPVVEVTNSAAKSRIRGSDYELDLSWPVDGMAIDDGDFVRAARLRRIVCGADGYLAWLSGGVAAQRFVVADRDWRPVAAFDFELPRLAREEGVHQTLLNFRQIGREVVIELLVERRKSEPRHEVLVIRFEHPLLQSDYGSRSKRWPGVVELEPDGAGDTSAPSAADCRDVIHRSGVLSGPAKEVRCP